MNTKLSFAGQSNKWNTAEDASSVVEAIRNHHDLRILDLENNTLGPQAAKAIGDALASHPEFERAHFKDLFTGRLKTEIPLALRHLFSGINRAGAKLRELDLSDNALGPVGVEGMVDFMCSPACYTLQELRLNNNGLGITGGTMLARSLEKLLDYSNRDGHPWKLKVFIAGRNRLEKVGAKVYSPIFERLGSLEELAMPQNGIFHEGIAALAQALSHNPNLRVLNLNDNTFTKKGATAMAQHLHAMQELRVINFGDCLLKSAGATALAKALMPGHFKLEELYLDGNELTAEGGLSVVEAMQNKPALTTLMLDDNMFGDDGRETIEALLSDVGKLEALQSLENNVEPDSDEEEEQGSESDDSSSSSDDDSDTDDAGSQETPANDEEEEDDIEVVAEIGIQNVTAATKDDLESSLILGPITSIPSTAKEFVECPTAGGLLGLPASELTAATLSAAATTEDQTPDQQIQSLVKLLVATAAMAHTTDQQLLSAVTAGVGVIGAAVFSIAVEHHLISFTTNTLLVYMGLIKCEDKQFSAAWQQRGVLTSLVTLVAQDFFPRDAMNTLQYFVSRPSPRLDAHPKEKTALLSALSASMKCS